MTDESPRTYTGPYVRLPLANDTTDTHCGGCPHLGYHNGSRARWCEVFGSHLPDPDKPQRLRVCTQAETDFNNSRMEAYTAAREYAERTIYRLTEEVKDMHRHVTELRADLKAMRRARDIFEAQSETVVLALRNELATERARTAPQRTPPVVVVDGVTYAPESE